MALAAVFALQQATTVFSAIEQNKMAQSQAKFNESQAVIAREEALREAKRKKNINEKFKARQKLAFLNNGITLEGSPLLVLEETQRLGDEEVKAILDKGSAVSNMFFERGALHRKAGRSALISGGISAVSTGLQGIFLSKASKSTKSQNGATTGTTGTTGPTTSALAPTSFFSR